MSKHLQLADLIIKKDEGFKEKPYYCSEGFPTIGYGRVVGKKNEPLPNIKTTRQDEQVYLNVKIASTAELLAKTYPNVWMRLNDVRRAVLISMAYQLGMAGVGGFKRMWAALGALNYTEAAKHMLDSKWYKQTPNRAKRNADMMVSGELDKYYRV